MKAILKQRMNKRGVLGLEIVKAVLLSLLGLAVISVAVLIVLGALNSTSTDAGISGNISLITNNISFGVTQFFGNIPTFFTLLAVVVIILIISIVIVAVNRFGTGPGAGGL